MADPNGIVAQADVARTLPNDVVGHVLEEVSEKQACNVRPSEITSRHEKLTGDGGAVGCVRSR